MLNRRGINTAVSLRWYGQIDFTEKGTAGALRVSPHYYNTEDEINAAVAAIRDILSTTVH
jgi:selenocysteine lyase/cysteine desulfurase